MSETANAGLICQRRDRRLTILSRRLNVETREAVRRRGVVCHHTNTGRSLYPCTPGVLKNGKIHKNVV